MYCTVFFNIMGKPILILLLLFGLGSTQYLPNGCPSDFSVHLLLPHEMDCQKFYSCSNGQKMLMTCGELTLFDFELQGCDWAHNVDCQITTTQSDVETTTESITATTEATTTTTESITTTTQSITATTESATDAEFLPNGCPADFHEHLLLPHETDCDKFYNCAHGTKVLFVCPYPTLFDANLQVCNWPNLVTCPEPIMTETTSSYSDITTKVHSTTEANNNTTEADNNTTERKTTITNSVATTENDESYYTDSNTNTTGELDDTSDARTEIDGIETTEAIVTTETDYNDSVCPDGFFGNIPHPDLCDSYFVCSFWEPIQLFCSSGLEFSPDLQRCVEIAEGGCFWLQQQRTTTTESTTNSQQTTVDITTTTSEATTIELTTTDIITTTSQPTTVVITTTEPSTTHIIPEETSIIESTTTNLFTTAYPTITENGTATEDTIIPDTTKPSTEYSTTSNEIITEIVTTIEPTQGPINTQDWLTTNIPDITTEGSDLGIPTTEESISTPETEDQSTISITSDITVTMSEKTDLPESTTELETSIPSICPDGYFGYIAHPEICNAYYLCTGWNPILLYCPSSQEFDDELATCRPIIEGGCTWYMTSTTSSEYTSQTTETDIFTTPNDTTATEKTTITDNNDVTEVTTEILTTVDGNTDVVTSTQYPEITTSEFNTGSYITQDVTTDNWTYTTEIETTDTPSVTTVTEEVTTQLFTTTTEHWEDSEQVTTEGSDTTITEETTEDITTTVTTEETIATTASPICPDNFFGNVPHRENCNAYYLCTGWNPILLFCPSRQEFDPVSATCVPVAEGGCLWQQTSTPAASTESMTETPEEGTTSKVSTEEVTTEPATTTEPLEGSTIDYTSTVNGDAITTSEIEITSTPSITEDLDDKKPSETSTGIYDDETTTTTKTTTIIQPTTTELTTIQPITEESTTVEVATITSTESNEIKDTSSPVTSTTDLSTTEIETENVPDEATTLTTEVETTTKLIEETTTSTTESVATTTTPICPDGFFGMIARPDKCDEYYMCTGWMPIPLRCPSGFEFNPESESCKEIAEGGCTWLSTSTVAPTFSLIETMTTDASTVTILLPHDELSLDAKTFTPLESTTTEFAEFVDSSTPTCPDSFFGMIPHPDRCDVFFLCSGWNPIELTCSAGFEFDQDTSACVLISNHGCTATRS